MQTLSDQEAMAQGVIGDGDLAIPMPPKFDDPQQERVYVKQRLAAAFRVFAMHGFDDGLAGHISVRDPVRSDCFWVNPVGIHFSKIKSSDLVLLDHDGQTVEGKALVNNAAFAIHSRIHHHRADVNAICHAHTRYGRSFSVLGVPLEPITQDACIFYENHAIYDSFQGVVHDTSEGDQIAAAMRDRACAILQNHGILTTGTSVDVAAALFVQMEGVCETQLLAQAAGELTKVPPEIAIKTRNFNGSDFVMWGYFQPMYQQVMDTDPSFLD